LRLTTSNYAAEGIAGVSNPGYWGIPVQPNTNYSLIFFAKGHASYSGLLDKRLESNHESIIFASGKIGPLINDWKQYRLNLTTTITTTTTSTTTTATEEEAATTTSNHLNGKLSIRLSKEGTVWLDVVSLFGPFRKDQENGLRIDLANMIEDIKPKFVRFPGGCFVEGDFLKNRFR